MNNKIYPLKYIIAMLICHYVKYIGIPNIFTINLLIIPIANYLVLKGTVFHPLEKDNTNSKKDISNSFLLITTLFNIIFFFITGYELNYIIFLVTSNIIEFIIIRPIDEVRNEKTAQNIEDYFKNIDKS